MPNFPLSKPELVFSGPEAPPGSYSMLYFKEEGWWVVRKGLGGNEKVQGPFQNEEKACNALKNIKGS